MKAVLLLSGGLDSYTAGALARAEGHELHALTVRYGQVHARELDAARAVAQALDVRRHVELDVDLAAFGGSALIGAGAIVIGVNALDYSGYPDCRPEYLESFERMAALATKAAVEGAPLRILAPLLHLSKAEIIRRGLSLGLDYTLTHSCYDPTPEGRPCGRCDSCRLRARGFQEAGVPDPVHS